MSNKSFWLINSPFSINTKLHKIVYKEKAKTRHQRATIQILDVSLIWDKLKDLCYQSIVKPEVPLGTIYDGNSDDVSDAELSMNKLLFSSHFVLILL